MDTISPERNPVGTRFTVSPVEIAAFRSPPAPNQIDARFIEAFRSPPAPNQIDARFIEAFRSPPAPNQIDARFIEAFRSPPAVISTSIDLLACYEPKGET